MNNYDHKEHDPANNSKKVTLQAVDPSVVIPTTFSGPTTVVSGRKVTGAAGTAIALGASGACKYVLVTPLVLNSNPVSVGDSTTKAANDSTQSGVLLMPGQAAVRFDIANIASLFVDSQVTGEGVSYAYFN